MSPWYKLPTSGQPYYSEAPVAGLEELPEAPPSAAPAPKAAAKHAKDAGEA